MITVPAIQPPAAPGKDAEVWRCICGNVLGVIAAGWVFVRWKDREVAAALPTRIKCNRCGRKHTRY
jgi:hypothetical protein